MMNWSRQIVLALSLASALPSLAQEGADENAKALEAVARKQLAAEKWDDAYDTLRRAAKLSDASEETQILLAEATFRTGRRNDALEILDDLSSSKDLRVPALFVAVLEAQIEDVNRRGGAPQAVQMKRQDIRDYLSWMIREGKTDLTTLQKYADVCRVLQDAEGLERSAEWLQQHHPKACDGKLALGDAAMAKFYRANQNGEDEAKAQHLAEAQKAFEAAAAMDDDRGEPWQRLGDVHAWSGQVEASNAAYAKALGRSPNSVDLGQLGGRIDGEAMVKVLEAAIERLDKSADAKTRKDDALLRYNAGWYFYYFGQKPSEAVKQFALAVAKEKSYTTSYYYIGRAAYDASDFDGASEGFAALVRETGPQAFAATLRENNPDADSLKIAKDIVGFLVGQMGDMRKRRFDLARDMAYGLTGLEPRSADSWQNYAFFCREAGDYEKSMEAYEKALAIAPKDPAIMNDTALILHFHLYKQKGAMDRAKKMYKEAIELAEKELKDPKISEERKAIVSVALRDARNNLRKAEKGIRTPG
ncbi:MAG: tetratricopeptide repeat protein [Planctomycetes bacterium]|nr:tetratricopeptide repeat protein [Planctomycetota bacterium]